MVFYSPYKSDEQFEFLQTHGASQSSLSRLSSTPNFTLSSSLFLLNHHNLFSSFTQRWLFSNYSQFRAFNFDFSLWDFEFLFRSIKLCCFSMFLSWLEYEGHHHYVEHHYTCSLPGSYGCVGKRVCACELTRKRAHV